MFKNKKILKEIQDEKEHLEKIKEELLFIKNQLEDTTPKIDISELYVWEENGLYSIVKLDVKNIRGRAYFGLGLEENGFETTLIDIFTNNIVYHRCAIERIKSKQWVNYGSSTEDGYYAYLYPLHKVDNNILAYTNKMVPLYVLQQLYYKLNNVDVNAHILKKTNN